MKLRILHTASNTQWGGQERRIFNECKWMADQGHEIGIITHGDAPLFMKAKEQRWRTFAVSFKASAGIKTFFQVKKALRKFHPHILNTHGNMDAKICLTAARGHNIPCTILSRHITPPVRNSWYNRLLYKNLATYIFTTSDSARKQIIRGLQLAEDKAFTVSSGIVAPTLLLSKEEARKRVLQSTGIEETANARFIGYIGRLDLDKGLEEILLAFDRIKKKFPSHYLIFVGSGGAEDEIKHLVKKLHLQQRVILAGYQSDPWPWYSAFECIILASRQNEGIPQSLLEAMLAGCPVIGTQVGGIPEIVEDKITGLLCPPHSPEALAEAMAETLSNEEKTLIRITNALDYASREHTIDAMGRKILTILSSNFPLIQDQQ